MPVMRIEIASPSAPLASQPARTGTGCDAWRRRNGGGVLGATLLLGASIVSGGCMTLDRSAPRTTSAVLAPEETSQTPLGRAWAAVALEDPSLSAFRLLPDSLEAFAARIALIDAAERTLDLQYYVFHTDDTGLFVADRLLAAAERGVRVRILVDDMYAHGVEHGLALFDAHPQIELRLFNPWTQRAGGLVRGVEFLLSPRLNHRMHNKMFIADGTCAILGGRNIGDDYMGASTEFNFRDLDVLTAGPVAREAGHLFDDFWNGPDAVPVSALRPAPDAEANMDEARARLNAHRERMAGTPYADAVRHSDFAEELRTQSLPWVFAHGTVVGDAPEKTVHAGDRNWTHTLADEVRAPFFAAEKELFVCSPYFVPGRDVCGQLCDMAARGVDVCVLTNSMASTDVPVAHAKYAQYRIGLVQGGVKLFEIRRRGADAAASEVVTPAYGSLNTSLHAKSFVIDRRRVFIGSLNFDPRSIVLNTEVGVLIDSPVLAESVAAYIQSLASPERSYRLEVSSATGKLAWVSVDAHGNRAVLTDDPDTTVWERLGAVILLLMPIENQT